MMSLPTWLLIRMAQPFFPKDHPWKGHRFTLAEWRAGQTDLCRQFDLGFWLCGLAMVLLIWLLCR